MSNMQVLVIVPRMGHVMIMTHGCRYTCLTREIEGKLCFKFKNQWFPVDEYTTPDTLISSL